MAPFARYKILILWALSVDQLPLATVDSVLSLSLSLTVSLFLSSSLLLLPGTSLLSYLRLHYVTTQSTDALFFVVPHYDRHFFLLLALTVRGIDLEKTRIMRDNASKLYTGAVLGCSRPARYE